MRRTLLRTLIILIVGVAVGATVNAVRTDADRAGRPRRLPWITPPPATLQEGDIVSLADAQALWTAGEAVFLDARTPADYRAGHIALAHNLPEEDFGNRYPELAASLTKDTAIIVYCDGVECDLSHEVSDRLKELGYSQVRVLVNGWTVWREAGLATSAGEQP